MRVCVCIQTCSGYSQILRSIHCVAGGELTLFITDQNRGYLHNFADDPVEKSHQLARGQLDLLFQLVHGFMLQANPQEKSLEDGRSAGVAAGTGPGPHKTAPRTRAALFGTKLSGIK